MLYIERIFQPSELAHLQHKDPFVGHHQALFNAYCSRRAMYSTNA